MQQVTWLTDLTWEEIQARFPNTTIEDWQRRLEIKSFAKLPSQQHLDFVARLNQRMAKHNQRKSIPYF